ncbi:alkaline phosphatase [Shewanella marina]|uniref:alkaline phosphatase n=1 Tax=Shewanella marina TaxID=487319 RepID=UPI00046E8298|nr:alkaline phosphatase [Shewanella marina]
MRFVYALPVGLSLLLVAQAQAATGLIPAPTVPKNIIIMVGDGMGPSFTSAYRYYKDDPATEEVEQTVFDRLLVGMASTYPHKQSGYITDSAAAATALATGVKTYNGAVSVDINQQPLSTIMQQAKARNMATAIVVSAPVTHATPAAFLAHHKDRKQAKEIAKQYLNSDVDLMLGGGRANFSQSLLEQFKAKGYQLVESQAQLEGVNTGKVIGLFAEQQLPWRIDQPQAININQLTDKALQLLSQQNPHGFVLLVEGSLIDWAGHSNDIATAMHEMDEFANSIETVEQFSRQHPDTLMVVTADHNTGGLSIGANSKYQWDSALVKGINASPNAIATQIIDQQDWQPIATNLLGFELTAAELEQLKQARMQGQKLLTNKLKDIINLRSYTGWTTHGHTGVDVQVFATGPGAQLFNGHQDNTDIADKLMSLLPAKTLK